MRKEILKVFKKLSNPERATFVARYFKTGPGGYAEGDKFHGLTVPEVRALARKYKGLQMNEVTELLCSPMHEERQMALMILVDKFNLGDEKVRKEIYNLYLANTKFINNWDLVDLTAPNIIGGYLEGKSKEILTKLTKSKSLWERRIAMLATFHYIKQGHPNEALKVAELLVHDNHDLIHKAVGWMLREVGKRCGEEVEETFLRKYASAMPRTMLRYAIERFPEDKKRQYMAMKKKN